MFFVAYFSTSTSEKFQSSSKLQATVLLMSFLSESTFAVDAYIQCSTQNRRNLHVDNACKFLHCPTRCRPLSYYITVAVMLIMLKPLKGKDLRYNTRLYLNQILLLLLLLLQLVAYMYNAFRVISLKYNLKVLAYYFI